MYDFSLDQRIVLLGRVYGDEYEDERNGEDEIKNGYSLYRPGQTSAWYTVITCSCDVSPADPASRQDVCGRRMFTEH